MPDSWRRAYEIILSVSGGGERPVYTAHARDQMDHPDRLVVAEVERVLAGYDMSSSDAAGNLRISGDGGRGRRVVVVVAKESNPPTIISVWPTGNRKRV